MALSTQAIYFLMDYYFDELKIILNVWDFTLKVSDWLTEKGNTIAHLSFSFFPFY